MHIICEPGVFASHHEVKDWLEFALFPSVPKFHLHEQLCFTLVGVTGNLDSQIPMCRTTKLLVVDLMDALPKSAWIGPWRGLVRKCGKRWKVTTQNRLMVRTAKLLTGFQFLLVSHKSRFPTGICVFA